MTPNLVTCLPLSKLVRMTKKNRAAVLLGRKGGQARAKNLTRAQRVSSAKKAIAARWKNHKKKDT
jgi:hypothetical protein